jgi:hypothetical protein
MITYQQDYENYKHWCEDVWGCAAPPFDEWMRTREGIGQKVDKAKEFLGSGTPDTRLTEVEVK